MFFFFFFNSVCNDISDDAIGAILSVVGMNVWQKYSELMRSMQKYIEKREEEENKW